MEQQRKLARRDRMSIAEQVGTDNRGDDKQELNGKDGKEASWLNEVSNAPQAMPADDRKMDGANSVKGKISTLRWHVPTNGISKLL
ncbi:hypothetical protein [Pedobacter endophyticus]|uniref:Uncharacterized protein n=1 Tax=Pedobacter endophyticus TaxID=2789740 RepID=A0A7S9PZY2_9SPHI|nr:hypothetical protein [Pedobacter endophyticus]QPH40176.1 hypothetical protein IZT61_02530 [Pedobacter endophyticus]